MQLETATQLQCHFHITATVQNMCSHMVQYTPLQNNWRESRKLNSEATSMSISCELSSHPVVQLTMEKKYFEEINILFVQVTEQ
jgi:hypothetical protein